MDVLVVHASKHGSTVGIAQTVATRLVERGHSVTIFDAEAADRLEPAQIDRCQAVVLGSAIYGGHWLKTARRFVDHHLDLLDSRPVWLFSSGPLGDPPQPDEDPVEVRALEEKVSARDHRVFSGALDPTTLNLAERAIVKVVKAPAGDFRDEAAAQEWADEIADALG